MSNSTNKPSEPGGRVRVSESMGSPKKGERYRCGKCGMEVQVNTDCGCNKADMVHFQCCGKELQKV